MPGGSSGSVAPAEAPLPAPPFALILAITLTGIMANTLVTPATPDIVADLGVGASGTGILLAATTAPGILLAPVIGVFADRYGRKQVLLPCLVVFGLSGGLSSFAPNFNALVACRLGQGVGAAGLINLAVVLIGDHWDGAERARRIGQNAAALTASIAVFPPLGGFLTAVGGWRLSFVPFWLGLVSAAGVFFLLPRSRPGSASLREQLKATAPYLSSATVLGPTAMAFVLFVLIFGMFLTVLPYHLAHEFGIGPSARGLILAAPAFTSTLTSLNLAPLRERFGARRLLLIGSLFLVAGLLVLGMARSIPILLISPVIYGFGEGLMIPTLQDLVAGAAPASSRGSVFAVFVGTTRAGQTVGPLTTGAALEAVATRAIFFAGAGLAGLLALAQVAIRERRPLPAGTAAATGELLE